MPASMVNMLRRLGPPSADDIKSAVTGKVDDLSKLKQLQLTLYFANNPQAVRDGVAANGGKIAAGSLVAKNLGLGLGPDDPSISSNPTLQNQVQQNMANACGVGVNYTPGVDGQPGSFTFKDAVDISGMTPGLAADILSKNFDQLDTLGGVGNADGLIGVPDLQAAVNDTTGKVSPEVKQAAAYVLQRPGELSRFDTGEGVGGTDNLISRNDLKSVAGFSAAQTVQGNFDVFDTAAGIGGLDGNIARGDLQAIVASSDPKVTDEMKRAAQNLLDNPDMAKLLDSGAFITRDVLQTYPNNSPARGP